MNIESIKKTINIEQLREGLSPRQKYGIMVGLIAMFLLIPQATDDFFLMNALIYSLLFVILGHSWNIIGGYAGQFSLGHAVMFAAGAYGTAIPFIYYGITPWIGLWVGALVAMALGMFLGASTFRLRYHYFAMATLAAALIARTIAFRWEWIGGASGIEYPFEGLNTLYSLTFPSKATYYYLIGVIALAVTIFMYQLDKSKLGVYLKAINYDQDLAQNAGLNVFWYKLYAMGLSSFLAGLAGGLYAQYVLQIDPFSTLRILRNIDIIIVPIIGGVGTVLGPVVGAFIYIPVREYTRTYLSGNLTGMGWVILGILIVLISVYRPGGLLGKYRGRWDQ